MRIGALVLGLIGAVMRLRGRRRCRDSGRCGRPEFWRVPGLHSVLRNPVWPSGGGCWQFLASIVAAGGAFMALNRPKASAAVFILTAGAGVYLITVALRRCGRIPGQRRAVRHLRQLRQQELWLRAEHRHHRFRPAATASDRVAVTPKPHPANQDAKTVPGSTPQRRRTILAKPRMVISVRE